ncbi:MAG: hypothetical protein RIQ79_50 [Verrucomicrobiota bacterium]
MKARLSLFLSVVTLALGGCSAILTDKTVGRPLTKTEIQPFIGKWTPGAKDKASIEVISRKDGTLYCIENENDKTSTWDFVVTTLPEHKDTRIAWVKYNEDKTADGPWAPTRMIWNEDNPNSLGLLLPDDDFIDKQTEKGELDVTKPSSDRLIGPKNLETHLLDNRFWDLDHAVLLTRVPPAPRRPDRKR